MSRLIDADAIKEKIDDIWDGRPLSFLGARILAMIDEAPTIDADRPQGEWIPSDTDGFVCSVCKNGYRNQPTLMGRPMFEYCPVCGARMKGADDE